VALAAGIWRMWRRHQAWRTSRIKHQKYAINSSGAAWHGNGGNGARGIAENGENKRR